MTTDRLEHTMHQAEMTIAVVGNPNTGKSTLFGALVGIRQRVGNYPGVTVERKVGRFTFDDSTFELIDLPGTYSLAPKSPDEMVAVDVLLNRRDDTRPVDAVLSIVDASNLDRNMYLVSQVLDLGLPTVVALNMTDIARKRGISIDAAELEKRLGVPVVEIQANRNVGLEPLKRALSTVVEGGQPSVESPLPDDFQREVTLLRGVLLANAADGDAECPRFLAERLLLDTSSYLRRHLAIEDDTPAAAALSDAQQRLADAGSPVPAVEAISRYQWIGAALDGVVKRPSQRVVIGSDRLDKILTHKLLGTLFFAAMMFVVFSSVFVLADPIMGFVDDGVGQVSQWVERSMDEGPLRSLLADGVIGGVGSVVIFLPQIVILFLFVAILEDCGYMARAAFLMDKLMARAGLSGKSFIPLLSSFACAIPGIMAARVIENRRDRFTTIMVAPLMTCSARLPVYTILIGAFIPNRAYLGGLMGLQGATLFALYLLGIVAAISVALVLKKTLLRGPTPPFVMELPSYKWPSPAIVLHRVSDRAWAFLRRAGTLIFAVSVIVWACSYYPRGGAALDSQFQGRRDMLAARLADASDASDAARREEIEQEVSALENEVAAAQQKQSILGRLGKGIEPVVRPLGWDWRIGCAVIASFPAREVVMSALGVIYHLGEDIDVTGEADQSRLSARLRGAKWDDTGEPVYNVPVALSIMVFFALCAQCASTLAVIRRETSSWWWPVFTFSYMTSLAYVAALATYQIGMMLPAIS